jgi:hypothetical protein
MVQLARVVARLGPALVGILILVPMLFGPAEPADHLCRVARVPGFLLPHCQAWTARPLLTGILATALIALSLLLLWRWSRARPRMISYDSDAGRWIVLGWILVAAGLVSLLAGLILVGSNGWPFSHQSRHIGIRTGQLPVFMSTMQPRYVAGYSGADGLQSLCASFGAVTIENRSRWRSLTLDLALLVTPHERGRATPQTAMPTRDDLTAIARRGLSADAVFRNPVALGPGQRVRRELVFVVRPATGGLSDADHDFALAVTDRGSGQMVSFALPAEYRG